MPPLVDGEQVPHNDDAMRSRAGYWLGGVILVLGVAGAFVWLAVLLTGVSFTVDGWLRVGMPANASVLLDERKYVVYYESPTAADEVPPFTVQVFDAKTGAQVPVKPYNGSFTYNFGREGSAQGT